MQDNDPQGWYCELQGFLKGVVIEMDQAEYDMLPYLRLRQSNTTHFEKQKKTCHAERTKSGFDYACTPLPFPGPTIAKTG